MITLRIRRPYLGIVSKKQVLTFLKIVMSTILPENKTDIGILICSDDEITQLNLQYRGIDRATDVLSFTSDEIDPETGRHYLGDIIVSCDTATLHANSAGHSVQTEIVILLIHGFLHLMEYDHDTEERKKEMWRIQFEIHRILNIDVQSLPGEND
jgi:probable rRNA maturation factor